MVSFSQVPANTNVPGVYAEIDSGRAGAGAVEFRSLLIGQRLAAGSVAAELPTLVGGAADAQAKFGAGSMLAIMAEAFIRQNANGELWAVALDDAAGAVQGTTTVTVSAAATGAGTIALYIAGRRVSVGISGAMTTAQVATAIDTAVKAAGGGTAGTLPVSSAASGSVVTLTNRNGGASVDIDVRHSYQLDEALPPGVGLAIAVGTAGATDPDITDATDAVDGEKFNIIGHPYNAASSMASLEAVLDSRWDASHQIDGAACTAYRGTAAAATTYGNARNSEFSVVMGISTSPMAVSEWAGAVAGAAALAGSADPARPFQTIALRGILPAPLQDRFTYTERNALLSDGIATHSVDRSGRVAIERLVTTYQETTGGVPDRAFMDLNTVLTASFVRADFRARMTTKFARFKLADDDGRFGPGQPIMTPRQGRAEAIAIFRSWEDQGLVENADGFKAGLVVERNANDRNRLDFLLPPDFVNQLRVIAANISFQL